MSGGSPPQPPRKKVQEAKTEVCSNIDWATIHDRRERDKQINRERQTERGGERERERERERWREKERERERGKEKQTVTDRERTCERTYHKTVKLKRRDEGGRENCASSRACVYQVGLQFACACAMCVSVCVCVCVCVCARARETVGGHPPYPPRVKNR